jgi:Domain of unknown function (DUF4189)
MIVTIFHQRAAIFAASAAVVTGLTVAVAPTAHADDQWGACAAGGKNPVCVPNMPSEAEAIARANSLCNYLVPNRPPCPVVVSFKDCGALAQSGREFRGGTGPTQQAAEQAADNEFAPSTIPIPTISKSVCNG